MFSMLQYKRPRGIHLGWKKMKIAVCVVFFITLSQCAKLPSNFKKCNRKSEDFSKCLAFAVQDAMGGKLSQPIKELGLPSLDPLLVPSMSIQAGNKAVGLTQNFKNVRIFGINNLECSQMDVDFDKKTIDNFCYYPEIRMESQYEIDGKILLLDIKGSGPGTVTLDKVNISVHYVLEEYEKNKKKHFRITDIDLKMEPQLVKFRFENLFNGDKVLSDNIHQVVNENWKEVYDDVKASYNDVFGRITKGIFNSLLAKVSISELFGNE